VASKAGLAAESVQQRLDQSQVGSATEAPDSFPGYCAVHITKGETTSGMLSVNAYTDQVW
jgi:hypothetical protein